MFKVYTLSLSVCIIIVLSTLIVCCMQKGQCKYSSSYIGATEKGVVAIGGGDESSMRVAVALKGPVSAAVDARSTSFRVREPLQLVS